MWLGVLVFVNVFAAGFCHIYEVHYEVNDLGEFAEAKFGLKHGIMKRAAMEENKTTTSTPSRSEKTTQSFFTNSTSSSTEAPNSLPTVQPKSTTTTLPRNKPATQVSTNTLSQKTNARTKLTTPKPASHHSTNIPQETTVRTNSITRKPVSHATTNTLENTTGRDNVTTPAMFATTSGSPAVNGTKITIIQDDHKYYTSHYFESGENWWFDLNDGTGTPKLHDRLSKNLQYSFTIETSFKFPYYGHEINHVTITNKGFLFLGQRVHTFNASMQYVAPIMADFGAQLNSNTTIHYVDTGKRFTVQWESMRLQNQQAGEFSFQCSILKNGTIVFAYKKIPIAVSDIKNETFPVRVGLSDSLVHTFTRRGLFIIDGRIYFGIRHFVYYRYHQVRLPREQVKNGSAFVMTPLPNCILFKSCDTCVNSKTQFSCTWCPEIERCSDGIDRHRQVWFSNKCDEKNITKCSGLKPGQTTSAPTQSSKEKRGSSQKHAVAATAIVFCVLVVITVACWFAYAYTHPLSKSGMFLMQYGNPRKWCGNSEKGSSRAGGRITFKSMSEGNTA